MKIVDAYAHVSLPRFLSTEEMLDVMRKHEVQQAILATADTCPDLVELSRAQVEHPEKFRSVGMPLGENIEQIKLSIAAQLQSGFIGIRLMDSLVLEHSQILDVIGELGGIPFVCGGGVLLQTASLLLNFLERYSQCRLVVPHFAGAPAIGDIKASARKLLSHPRFAIIFSRQGAYPPTTVRDWARHLVGEIGWSRLMFGSEYPVCVWRDETFDDVVGWIDQVGLSPGESDRRAFFHDNAAVLFAPRPTPLPLDSRWCRMDLKRDAPVWYFPQNTLDVDEQTNRKLITAWHRSGPVIRFRDFVAQMLRDAAGKM
jgi:predicted TIM-barrel fold metal-dependent hydrolase